MEKMLTEICEYLNNYFPKEKFFGKFKIENGRIVVPQLKEGQYFRIVGSTFSDGVHKYPITEQTSLTDEEFDGAIWSMVVPTAIIDLASEIAKWVELYGGFDSQAMSPFSSESFGNYSYSKSVASGGSSGDANAWQTVFSSRLAPYRRLRNIP